MLVKAHEHRQQGEVKFGFVRDGAQLAQLLVRWRCAPNPECRIDDPLWRRSRVRSLFKKSEQLIFAAEVHNNGLSARTVAILTVCSHKLRFFPVARLNDAGTRNSLAVVVRNERQSVAVRHGRIQKLKNEIWHHNDSRENDRRVSSSRPRFDVNIRCVRHYVMHEADSRMSLCIGHRDFCRSVFERRHRELPQRDLDCLRITGNIDDPENIARLPFIWSKVDSLSRIRGSAADRSRPAPTPTSHCLRSPPARPRPAP